MTNLVANELKQAGFQVVTVNNFVQISLTNRKVSTMEVKYALNQIFDEIEFTVQSTGNSVLVTL